MAKEIKTDESSGSPVSDLYAKSYAASLTILKNVVPFIKNGDVLRGKLTHSAKEVPRLIAAGLHGSVPLLRKSHTLGEAALCCRESVVMLSFCRDLHGQFINGALCAELISTYQSIGDELGKIIEAPAEIPGGQS